MTAPVTKPGGSIQRLWYASYGSNLCYERRFMCYITGGTPLGAHVKNPGCRDKTRPSDNRPVSLDFELYFADQSDWWGGAVAFIRQKQGNINALGRMYLITYEQFNDVVLQENALPVGNDHILPPFVLLQEGYDAILPRTGRYGRLLCMAKVDGYPVLTFTATRDDLQPGIPSKAYVRIITAGIKETYPGMSQSDICEYFLSTEGVRDSIERGELMRWISDTPASS